MSKIQCQRNFPYDIVDVEASINSELLQYFHGERTGFVQVGPERYFFPYKYKAEALNYYNFEAREDDVWIATLPRSGTTWSQELIWLVANELNFEEAKNTLLTERFPFFEFPLFVHDELKKELLFENAADPEKLAFLEHITRPGYKTLSELPHGRRRFIKTHFPFSLLPPSVMSNGCKVIYVERNPKDVAVSYYHLNRLFRTQGFKGDFERYWRYFQAGLNPWLPYHSHVREAHAQRHQPNILFLNYEDMIVDLRAAIQKVANFLDCRLSSDGIDALIKHLDINNFRLNSSVNMHEMEAVGVLNRGEAGFVRKGGGTVKAGGEQQEFANNSNLLEKVNAWINANNEIAL